MPGAPDPLYVRARSALLDALDALQPHLDAVVLVGAQAVYVHTGNADVGGAEYTTDADFSISPSELADSPILGDLLAADHGFTPREHPGGWLSPSGIYIDLMVPEALAGPGTRGARLGTHGKRAARRAKGLEGATVDRDRSTVAAARTDGHARDGNLGGWPRGASCGQGPQDRRTSRYCRSGPRQGCARRAPTASSRRHRPPG